MDLEVLQPALLHLELKTLISPLAVLKILLSLEDDLPHLIELFVLLVPLIFQILKLYQQVLPLKLDLFQDLLLLFVQLQLILNIIELVLALQLELLLLLVYH